jgi:hypothetical protein
MQESSRTNRIESNRIEPIDLEISSKTKKDQKISFMFHALFISYSSLYCKKYNAQAYHGAYSSVDNTGTTTTTTTTTTYSRHYSWDNNN